MSCCAQVVACGAKLLSNLKAYSAAARFQGAAEKLVNGHAQGSALPTREATKLAGDASAALLEIAEELGNSHGSRPAMPGVISALHPQGTLSQILGLLHITDNTVVSRCIIPVKWPP